MGWPPCLFPGCDNWPSMGMTGVCSECIKDPAKVVKVADLMYENACAANRNGLPAPPNEIRPTANPLPDDVEARAIRAIEQERVETLGLSNESDIRRDERERLASGPLAAYWAELVKGDHLAFAGIVAECQRRIGGMPPLWTEPQMADEDGSLHKYGVMTEEHRQLADALGLREGKHTAASVARIARERLMADAKSQMVGYAARMDRFERLARAVRDPVGITNRLRDRDACAEDVETLLDVYPQLLADILRSHPDAVMELCKLAPTRALDILKVHHTPQGKDTP